jgi:3-mercaptopyruvate sulfurtransferase SseA
MSEKQPVSRIIPIVSIVMGVLLIVGAMIVVSGITTRPEPVEPSDPQFVGPHPDVSRISVTDAKMAYDNGEAVFVDVRGEPYYSEGHIPGALSIEESEVLARLTELNPEDLIITYCT